MPPIPPDPEPEERRTPGSIRLLVVDADRRVRAGLAGLLALADDVEVVASEGHARAALDACETRAPDVVVVDPRLPELPEGIAFVRALRAEHPDVKVVVIAWSASLGRLLEDDPAIAVVAADGGDLADRILAALGQPGARQGAARDGERPPDPADADARLGPTAA